MKQVAVVGMTHRMFKGWLEDNKEEEAEYILIYGIRDARGYKFQDIVYGPYTGITDPEAVKWVENIIKTETGEYPADGKLKNISIKQPHKSSEVICIKCRARWIAVRPEETRLKQLECGTCGATGYVIETGEDFTEE